MANQTLYLDRMCESAERRVAEERGAELKKAKMSLTLLLVCHSEIRIGLVDQSSSFGVDVVRSSGRGKCG